MTLRSVLAPAIAAVLVFAPVAGQAAPVREAAPVSEHEAIAANPWVPWLFGLAALIAIIVVVTDDEEEPVSA